MAVHVACHPHCWIPVSVQSSGTTSWQECSWDWLTVLWTVAHARSGWLVLSDVPGQILLCHEDTETQDIQKSCYATYQLALWSAIASLVEKAAHTPAFGIFPPSTLTFQGVSSYNWYSLITLSLMRALGKCEFLILLPLPPKNWDYRFSFSHLPPKGIFNSHRSKTIYRT